MFEIKVTVSCPDLVLAATALSKALIGRSKESEQPANPTAPAASAVCPAGAAPMTAPAAVATPAPVVAPVAPVNPESPIPAAPIASPAPAAAPAPAPTQTASVPVTAAPISAAPQITIEQLSKAGADLITANPAAIAQLTDLLQKYNVQSAQQLKPEQIGPFATEMRALGARI